MAEELKEQLEGDRTKGFVSLSQPFIYSKDEQDEDVKQILTEHNYQSYLDSLDDSSFNEKGVPFYCLTFYEVQDQESPCSFFPEEVRSSNQNEVSPLEWNTYASCCRFSKGRYLVTGGVSLQIDYADIFQKKFDHIIARQKQVKEYKEFIDLLSQKSEGESADQQRTRMMVAFQRAFLIKQDLIDWKAETDFDTQKKLLVQIFQNEITKSKLKCEKELAKMDRDYCKQNNIVYRFNEELSPEALVFNSDSPYSTKAIEIVFTFIPHEDKYEFTARYIEPMPASLSNHQSVYHMGKIYVMGGVCKQNIQKSVYAYDIIQQTWSILPDMNIPRVNFTAVSHGDYIYVLGGHTVNFQEDTFDFTNLERINPSENQEGWQKLTIKKKMGYINYSEHQLKLISYKGQLILLGGGATKKDIENPKENTQLSKIDILADNKWQLVPIQSTIQVRKGELVAPSNFRGEECFYIYGGVQKLQLECFKLDVNNNDVAFEKILDNDYTEEVSSYESDHIICQPNIFID